MTADQSDTPPQTADEANVRRTIRELLATPEAKGRMDEGAFKPVGAVYELETGSVRFLD